MRRGSFATVLMLAVVPLLVGCGDDDEDTTAPEPTFDLTFVGDDTFQGAHGGQTLHVGIFHPATGALVANDQGTVSATADPSFEFTFMGILAQGESYRLDYWIDSNFGGGGEGSCDPPATDHQWRITVSTVTADVTIADTHRPGETQSVCGGANNVGNDPGY